MSSQSGSGIRSPSPEREGSGGAAVLVGAGIFVSRLLGLVRQRVLAHYLGTSMAAAAYAAALRIPNFLQNLLGEGVLSASFIPVYARLLGKGDRETAQRVAGAVFGLLSFAVAVLVAVGVTAAPWAVGALLPGDLQAETKALTVTLVRILFPGVGLLVLSAWCLGVLNSHRRFFLSYAAPALWNVAIIAAAVVGGRSAGSLERLAEFVAWGTVAGCFLQLLVQLPEVLRLLGRLRPSLNLALPDVRQVLRSFGPVVVARGVVQVSAFLDLVYVSFLTERALASLQYAQMLYLLPVSLFGMSVSAAELPEMSRADGTAEEVSAKLCPRLVAAWERVAFFVVPSAVVFLCLGDVVFGGVVQTGRLGAADARYGGYLLMGASVGLLSAAVGRLFSSAFFALKDTKTPLKFSIVRVGVSAGLAFASVFGLPRLLDVPTELAAVGIPAASGIGAWVEMRLLGRALRKRLGDFGLSRSTEGRLWLCAGAAGVTGLLVKWGLAQQFGVAAGAGQEWGGAVLPAPGLRPELTAALVLLPAGLVYLVAAWALRVPQVSSLVRRVLRRRG